MLLLERLQTHMATASFDALLVPRADAYLNEDIAPCEEYLAQLSGFTGSQGLALATREACALFVDGRYGHQAAQQVNDEWQVLNSGLPQLCQWICRNLTPGAIIAIDGNRHSIKETRALSTSLSARGFTLQVLDHNPLEPLWSERPEPYISPVVPHPESYAGMSSEDKCHHGSHHLIQQECDALLVPSPDLVAWLLNVRGQDINISPLPFSRAILFKNGTVEWFIASSRLTEPERWLPRHVTLRPSADWPLPLNPKGRIWLDPMFTNACDAQRLQHHGYSLHHADSPLMRHRACKNTVESQGMQQAHVRDGVAMCRFLYEYHRSNGLAYQDEESIVRRLSRFRERDEDYRGPSFDTIAAVGANATQPHYLPERGNSTHLSPGQLLLIDSGGQYLEGTTDITRTLPIASPTPRQCLLYTLTLKGHIALASCSFPAGTSGMALDAIARRPLWEHGLDYAHGTGHGVGSYLNVHEGPHRIAKEGSNVPLEPGMVTSIEPGVYLPEEGVGVRIENLYQVVQGHPKGSLCFQVLTLAPMSFELIDFSYLDITERRWVARYHQQIHALIANRVEPELASWLRKLMLTAQDAVNLR